MTKDEIGELRALLEGARGPWKAQVKAGCGGVSRRSIRHVVSIGAQDVLVGVVEQYRSTRTEPMGHGVRGIRVTATDNFPPLPEPCGNAALIVAAINKLPALLDTLTLQAEALREAKEALLTVDQAEGDYVVCKHTPKSASFP